MSSSSLLSDLLRSRSFVGVAETASDPAIAGGGATLARLGYLAGLNAGGTIVLHRSPGLIYSADEQAYCGRSNLSSCDETVATAPADPESTVVFHALAFFPAGSAPRLKAMAFGIHYDPARLVLVAHGPCIGDLNNGALELPGPGWPATDTGTSIVFQDTQTSALVESYWFAAYAYVCIS